MSFSMPLLIYKKLKAQAKKESVSMTALLVKIIYDYLEDKN